MTSVSSDRYLHTSSASHPVVKLMRGLQRKKDRRLRGLFLVCGAQLVREAVQQRWQVCHAVVCGAHPDSSGITDLVESVRSSGGRVTGVSPSVMEGITRGDGRQCIAAAVGVRRVGLEALAIDGRRRYLACYQVRDPGNLGTLLRTAYAAVVDGVILIERCCDPFCGASVRASMGAIFGLPLVQASSREFLEWQRSVGASVAGAVVEGSCHLDQVRSGQRSVVLLGNERDGIPSELEAVCEQRVRIPMRSGFHSLNLASAGSIMMYAMWRDVGYAGGE